MSGSRSIARIDLAETRTPFPWYWIVSGVLVLFAILTLVVAATRPRWALVLAAAQEKARRNTERRAAEWAAEVVERQERSEREAAECEAAIEEREHAERVRHLLQWRDAYRDANDGQEPPTGFVPVGLTTAPPARTGTNVMAILALIFGLGGGLLGIIFGHVSLAQIRRTGENGRGLAIAGLIFGYLGLAILSGGLIFVLVAARSFY